MKLINYISYFTLALAFGTILLAAYWLIRPYKPIVFNNLPIKVDNKIVKAGEMLTYDVDYCKYSNLLPDVSRYFVDQIVYLLPAETALAKQEGCHIIKIQTPVPPTLPPSTYYLKLTYRYHVNPIKTFDVSVETERFQVVK
jgi:hypothetical protein